MKPFRFFAMLSAVLTLAALALGIPVIIEFADTRTVPRLPTALLSVGLQVIAFVAFMCGIVLDSLARARREVKRLAYLRVERTF